MRIDRLDHIVLTVVDISATIAFYSRVLGMQEITFGDQRKALIFGQQKINLHSAGRPIAPHAASPTPGSADLCFIVPVVSKKCSPICRPAESPWKPVRYHALEPRGRSFRSTFGIPMAICWRWPRMISRYNCHDR
ncbi:MAG: VOC family protein [Acidithiobacillus sp.]